MASSRAVRRRHTAATLAAGLALAGGGAALAPAWRAGMWASLSGAALVIAWIIGLGCWSAFTRAPPTARPTAGPAPGPTAATDDDAMPLRALLDQVPVPLVRSDAAGARAINRAARALFATDDRILPAPPPLLDPAGRHLRHEGRSWQIDAVEGVRGERLLALADIDAAERAAEDRAADEMVDILGHELLNGLSPIVSLADTAATAAARGDALLPEILATLARRIEGLEGFTRAYRDLARLPDPVRAPVSLDQLAGDLARLFAGRFDPAVTLSNAVPAGLSAAVDRDQLTQAVWALLQNGAEAALAAAAPRRVALSAIVADGRLTIEVRDTGAGVAPAERARVFRAFHTTKPEGSGIGLTLARRIARAHGGDVLLLPTATATFQMRVPAG